MVHLPTFAGFLCQKIGKYTYHMVVPILLEDLAVCSEIPAIPGVTRLSPLLERSLPTCTGC